MKKARTTDWIALTWINQTKDQTRMMDEKTTPRTKRNDEVINKQDNMCMWK